jgi:two-component system nitrogen regulation sensor histidine kinase GlnL
MHLLPNQYINIMDQLSFGVLIFNKSNILIYINNKGQELLDTSERKAVGFAPDQLFLSASYCIRKGVERARKDDVTITDHEATLTLITGRQRTVNLSISRLMHDELGEGNVIVELTHVDRYMQINRDEQIIAQNEIATDMLRSLAHEIKNPLGGLRGAAQLLAKELDEELIDYTDVIIEEADRLTNLVDRMLGSSALPLHQPINVHVVLERVRQLVQVEVDNKIKITTDYDPSIPDITGDKDQLIQAVLNVVRNAVQAVPDTGEVILKTRVQRQFTIGEITHKLAVKIDVIDNGIGINSAMLKKVFYPMITGRTEGTGLGLSIAQTNAHNHGGIIEVKSRPGKTVFSVILPIGAEHE